MGLYQQILSLITMLIWWIYKYCEKIYNKHFFINYVIILSNQTFKNNVVLLYLKLNIVISFAGGYLGDLVQPMREGLIAVDLYRANAHDIPPSSE